MAEEAACVLGHMYSCANRTRVFFSLLHGYFLPHSHYVCADEIAYVLLQSCSDSVNLYPHLI